MRKLFTLGLAFALLSITAPPVSADGWQLIPGESTFEYGGKQRVTACAYDDPETVDGTSFAFYVREGDPDKLAIFFDGGGACWDSITCLIAPTFTPGIDTPEQLANQGGLGDLTEADNPIKDYTQVFIPYCTGDLHTGARDTDYPAGTIRHRGADNVAFVLKWLKNYYQTEVGYAPRDVFLFGASAGGYGVTYHYPAIARMLPWYTRTRVLVDAANGVITDEFYNLTLTPGGVWGVWENLATELQPAFASGADQITVELFKALAYSYPGTRFGQYTTAFDETQIGFFNLARNIGNPDLWDDENELALSALEWTIRARVHMNLVALQTWNYRYYVAAGSDHTIVGSDKFYTEDSAAGVPFVDWLDDMINRRWLWWGSDWRNVSCTPNCLELE